MLLAQLTPKRILTTPAAGWQPGMESGNALCSGPSRVSTAAMPSARRYLAAQFVPSRIPGLREQNSLAAHDRALSAAPHAGPILLLGFNRRSRSTVRCGLAEDQERSVKSVGQVVINRALASSFRRWPPTECRLRGNGKPAALKARPGSVEVWTFLLCHLSRCAVTTDIRPH